MRPFPSAPDARGPDGSRNGWIEMSTVAEAGFRLLNWVWRKCPVRSLPTHSPRAIGILKMGYIGDVVITTGMVRHVKDRYPSAKLHYFCFACARPVVADNPRVDKVWSPSWFELRGLRGLARLRVVREMIRFTRKVRRERIDLLLVPCRQHTLFGTLKIALATWMIRARLSVGMAYRQRGFFLDVKVPDRGLLVKHESAWCTDVLRAAGIEGDCSEPCVEVSPGHTEAVRRLLARHGVADGEKVVLLHPGGGRGQTKKRWTLKRWPVENFAQVAYELGRLPNVRVAVAGTEDERTLFERIRNHNGTAVIDLVGQTSLQEFSALARRASVFIGNDSGATHLAAASGAPTIVIFGYTDFIGYHPLGSRVIILRRDMPCAPCVYWFEKHPCGHNQTCIRGVTPDQVVSHALDLLG